MIFNVLTLYPEMIEAYKEIGIIGRGVNSGKLQINAVNIRDYSKDKHRRVDDEIYGGGAGMLMKAEPVYDCVKDIKKNRDVPVIYFSPRGKIFNSEIAKEYADLDEVILLCGHYEGIDQRAVDLCVDEEISIGDYILTGGHIASMVFMDTVSRYVDGVLGNCESYQNESFEDGLLEASQYTRPEEFMGMKVPEVLLSGHHKKIEEYYKDEALKETKKRREDLL